MKINENERKVLELLEESYFGEDDWGAWHFKPLVNRTKLTLKEVRRACRSLHKKGLTSYERALIDDDGNFAGAGYRTTEQGAALVKPCLKCAKRGTMLIDWRDETKGLYCEAHYAEDKQQKILTPPLNNPPTPRL